MPSSRPSTYLNWTDGSSPYVIQPPTGQRNTGWVNQQKPPFRFMNWLFWETDIWIQYLDQQSSGMVNVKTFGAKGDDSTDDTAAIQAAMDTNKLVFFPPGKYRISASLIWKSTGGNGMVGCGCDENGTFIRVHSSVVSGFTMVKSDGSSYLPGMLVRDIVFEGPKTVAGLDNMVGIDFSYFTYGSLIDHCEFAFKGNNTFGIYGKPPIAPFFGGSPYYTDINWCVFSSNNDGMTYSGSVGIMFDENVVSETVPQGPNANRIRSGRFFSLDVAVWIKAGNTNYVEAIDGENIIVDMFRVGHSEWVTSGLVNTATFESVQSQGSPGWGVSQWSGGVIFSGAGEYREIVSNTADTIFTLFDWEVLPSHGDTYRLWYGNCAGNVFIANRQEGAAGCNHLRLFPQAFVTQMTNGKTSSLGGGQVVKQDCMRSADRINPETVRDPIPIVFAKTGGVAASTTNMAIFQAGVTRRLPIPYQWHVISITCAITSALAAGQISATVLDNGGAIAGGPHLVMSSANSSNLDGGVATVRQIPFGTIQNTGPGRTLGVEITTDGSWSATTADIFITLWLQPM